MTLREFGFYISGTIHVIVTGSSAGNILAVYDEKNSIPEEVLDLEVVRITSAQIGVIWIEVRD